MAIIRCPSCSSRMSSKAQACPNCHTPIGQLSQEERDRLAIRRWRAQAYRARNFTYLAMTLVVVGMVWWWLAPPQGLGLPVPSVAGGLLGLGLVGYLAAWGWLVWLKFFGRPDTGG
ncbi:hypothetical protein [Halomonas denitrificans]|nr:hypothetical protein [Halomonas denitrificans]